MRTPTSFSKAAITATALTVGLLSCELVARVLDLAPPLFLIPVEQYRLSEDAEMGYELQPGARTDGDITVSRQGLRDREYLVPKPAGSFRIAMIGDSVVFGFELAGHEALPKVLETLLNEAAPREGHRYEVMNFGVTGYNSHQIARRVAIRVLPFQPDLIVYVYCLNDPQQYSFEFEQVLAQQGARGPWSAGRLTRNLRASVLRSQLYRLTKDAVRRVESGANIEERSGTWDDPQWRAVDTHDTTAYFTSLHRPSPEWDRARSDIAGMATLAKSAGSGFVGVIVPLLEPYPGQYPLAAVHRRVTAAFESSGASVFDLAPPIERFSKAAQFPVRIDLLHFSPEGSRFAALAIVKYLLTAGLIPEADAVDFPSVQWTDPAVRMMLKWL